MDGNEFPHSAFEATGRSTSSMFEILDATDDDVVAVRVHGGTPGGYRDLYQLLVEKTAEHGSVHLYEEAPGWTFGTYCSHFHGLVPDLRYGPKFDIERYAAVGDSPWARLLFSQWKVISPVFPVSPGEMRYYEHRDRTEALDWILNGEDSPVVDNPGSPWR